MSKDLYETQFVKVGEVIEGTVIDVKDRQISLDINTFTEGTMFLDYYTLDKSVTSFKGLVKVGDKITCEVTKVDEQNGNIYLSRIKAAKKEAFKEFASENISKPITVKIKKVVNKGYITEANGVEFFLPEKEALGEKHVGDKFKALVLRVEEERGSGLVSERIYKRELENAAKAAEFAKLSVGQTIEGSVLKIVPFGIFVKFGELQGLVRNKELDHVYIANPSSVYKEGDSVKAQILSLENGKIDLSIKALKKSPIELFAETHKVSDVINVKVAQKMPFGVICEVAENLTGLLHKSELSWNPDDNSLAYLHIGDSLEVAIIDINKDKNKVSLSKKALIDNPWSRVNANVGDTIEAKVSEVTPKGLKIEALGVDGLIDIRDINLNKNSSKLDDYYAVGDTLKAIVTKIDTKAWILKASQKEYEDRETKAQFDEFMQKQEDETPETTIGDIFKDLK